MILPVLAYGHPALRKVAKEIDASFPELKNFIENMFDTMYQSDGVGLAAPQVNHSIRVITIDASAFAETHPETTGFKKVFINPKIYLEEGEEWSFNEGCLSFPGLRQDILRKPVIRIRWFDEDFQPHDEQFDGIVARVLQHEYDHLEGILFVDRMNALKRMVIKGRLTDISKGKVDTFYKMIFPMQKKGRK
jgi:peptide deformylase